MMSNTSMTARFDLLLFVFHATSANPEIYVVEHAEIEEKVVKANGTAKPSQRITQLGQYDWPKVAASVQ
jgi:hypothetical protein